MTIDSETKRRSVLNIPWIMPIADSTISATDRMHVTGFYSGVDLSIVTRGEILSLTSLLNKELAMSSPLNQELELTSRMEVI